VCYSFYDTLYIGNKRAEYAKPQNFDGKLNIVDGADESGYADIKITEVEDRISGTILFYKETLEEGDLVKVDVFRGRNPVSGTIVTSGANISIKERVLASGIVDVRITDGNLPYAGTVESYNGLLPEVGDEIPATVEPGVSISTANPDQGSYTVFLSESTDYNGKAVVRITEITDRIRGEVVEKIKVSQSSTEQASENPFDTENSTWNITRKKH
jgi:hypothetical protein